MTGRGLGIRVSRTVTRISILPLVAAANVTFLLSAAVTKRRNFSKLSAPPESKEVTAQQYSLHTALLR